MGHVSSFVTEYSGHFDGFTLPTLGMGDFKPADEVTSHYLDRLEKNSSHEHLATHL